jgi:CBS domain-containing protein
MDGARILDFVRTSQAVVDIPVDASVREAWRLMRYHGIHHLLVRKGAEVVGTLSDRDIFERGLTTDQFSQPVVSEWRTAHDVMVPMDRGIEDQATVLEAIECMNNMRCSMLPVFRGGMLIGVVTDGDILRALSTTSH